MILFGISGFLCLLFVYVLYNLICRTSFTDKVLGIYLFICAYVILTFETASLFKAISNPYLLLFIQLFLLGLALAGNKIVKAGFPKPQVSVVSNLFKETARFFKKHKLIGIFLIFIAITYGFLIFIQFRFPQNTTDSLYNHLSRIGHWMQQGSLAPYDSFNDIGETYPFNHSLLMMWPMVFLRSDALAGLVQFTSAILISITIYAISREFGFKKEKGIVNGLIFLTFPIVALQSITAQNDLVISCFLIIAFHFLIRAANQGDVIFIFLSTLSFSLAIGSKQYALFALPGYTALFIYFLLKHKRGWKKHLVISFSSTLVCVLLFGSYAYIQNWITRGSFVGVNPFGSSEKEMNIAHDPPEKITMTAGRFVYQFLSCEGIPPTIEKACIALKASTFRPLLVNHQVNIEMDHFLADQNEPFTLQNRYSLNEESSWFGLIGAILLILAFVSGCIDSIRKRIWAALILIITSLVFFLIFCVFLHGWGPYYGRYFIFSAVLLMPLMPSISIKKRIFFDILVGIACLLCVFVLDYAILNNDSRPLISKAQMVNPQRWGEWNPLFCQLNPYKFIPWVRNDNDVWRSGPIAVSTWGARNYSTPAFTVNVFVPEDAKLAIFDNAGSVPDYLYYGDSLSRKLYEFSDGKDLDTLEGDIDFVLVNPEIQTVGIKNFDLIFSREGWRLLKRANP